MSKESAIKYRAVTKLIVDFLKAHDNTGPMCLADMHCVYAKFNKTGKDVTRSAAYFEDLQHLQKVLNNIVQSDAHLQHLAIHVDKLLNEQIVLIETIELLDDHPEPVLHQIAKECIHGNNDKYGVAEFVRMSADNLVFRILDKDILIKPPEFQTLAHYMNIFIKKMKETNKIYRFNFNGIRKITEMTKSEAEQHDADLLNAAMEVIKNATVDNHIEDPQKNGEEVKRYLNEDDQLSAKKQKTDDSKEEGEDKTEIDALIAPFEQRLFELSKLIGLVENFELSNECSSEHKKVMRGMVERIKAGMASMLKDLLQVPGHVCALEQSMQQLQEYFNEVVVQQQTLTNSSNQ